MAPRLSALLAAAGTLSPHGALAAPEGSPQLGAGQGLADDVVLRVDVLAPGEVLRVCSSDEGSQEADADGLPVDAAPGEPHAVTRPARVGAEIVLAPPGLRACGRDADCWPGARCFSHADLPVEPALAGACGFPRSVTPGGDGHCDAATGPGRWQTLVALETGAWYLSLAGEPETLTGGAASTRYFAAEVLSAEGVPVAGGRVHAARWSLDAHAMDRVVDLDLYAVSPVASPVRGSAGVFRAAFASLTAFRYGVVANAAGIADRPGQSWCQFGDPALGTLDCPFFGGGPAHAVLDDFELYLDYPEAAPPLPPAPALGDVAFNDAAGTRTLTPDGDGVQDAGAFTFTSNLGPVGARYSVVVDTDADGRFDTELDRVLTGRAAPGGNRVEWDGRDATGRVVRAGQYAFRLELVVAETHLPLTDVESNSVGFLVDSLASAGGAPVPAPLYWDDRAIRTAAQLVGAGDVLTSLPAGSAQRRRWVQPRRHNPEAAPGLEEEDVPQIYDTWVTGARAVAERATCRTCAVSFDHLQVGGADEPGDVGDRDGDGLPDAVEDANGNGRAELDESDPGRVDTDGDGLSDAIEDANANGLRDIGETHPNLVDTDGDGLADGDEDANRDGRVGAEETDPRQADSDGDGLRDDVERRAGTDPRATDSDGDTLEDGVEDADGDGVVGPGETSPHLADTDHDGLDDAADPAPLVPTVEVEPDGAMVRPDGAMPTDAGSSDGPPPPDGSVVEPEDGPAGDLLAIADGPTGGPTGGDVVPPVPHDASSSADAPGPDAGSPPHRPVSAVDALARDPGSGCACSAAGTSTNGTGPWLWWAALAAAGGRRRRREGAGSTSRPR